MNTPKQRFQALPEAKSFLQTIHQADLVLALDYAFLQMVNEQPLQGTIGGQTDMSSAAANAFRLEGARRFIAILTTLPIMQEARKPPPPKDNLEP